MDPDLPEPDVEAVPAVRAAAELVTRLAAEPVGADPEGVTRSRTDVLAAAGLHGVLGPPELGGVVPPAARRVAELLVGADPETWFVWFQHGPVAAMLAGSENTALAGRHLAALCRGEEQAGVAFSHLRSPDPSITAQRDAAGGGWLLSGSQPWCTGWGIIDHVLVGALTDAGASEDGEPEVLLALVPARATDGLSVSPELPLAAMAATHTVALRLDRLRVPDEAVVLRLPHAQWAAADRARNANVQPSTFGIALAACDLLAQRQPAAADTLRARVLDVRTRAYRLLDEVPGAERTEDRLALRAQALLITVLCTTTAVAARGGQAMAAHSPEQRLARAATFHLLHAQDPAVREATVSAATGWGAPG